MKPIVTYRLTDTRIWSYHFYTGRRIIGKASSMISLSSIVRIEVDPVSWYSMFHMDTMVIPGISRKVMDDRTGHEVFRIVYCEPSFYRIMGREMNLLVEYRDNAYLFGNPSQPVIAITKHIREWTWVPDGEPFFQTTIYEDNLTNKLTTAILAFPALRF